MIKKWGIKRIIFSTCGGCILLVASLWIAYKVTLASYSYTENIIVSEAQRVTSHNVTKMELTITKQSTLDDIAIALYDSGLITNAGYFKIEAKLEDTVSEFIPGEYSITSNMSTSEILSLLTTNTSNDNEVIKFTIPEGYTITQIADVLETKNIVSKEVFLNTISTHNFESDYAFLKDIPINDGYKYKLEGYLFPDTYIVPAPEFSYRRTVH